MPVKTFLRLTACTTSVIGLTLLFFPGFVAGFFLPVPAHGSDIFIRFLGSTLIGYTYLNWYTAQLDQLILMRATLIGNLSTLTIAFLISLIGVITQDLKTTGILIILLHLVFALGFGYYTYKIRDKLKP